MSKVKYFTLTGLGVIRGGTTGGPWDEFITPNLPSF